MRSLRAAIRVGPIRPFGLGILLVGILVLAGTPARAGLLDVAAQPVATGLDRPVFAISPDGDERLFIVERPGRVLVLVDGAVLPVPFLDISGQVGLGGEGGLLGLAFAPDFATSGLFYVYYTDTSGDSVVSRFAVGADPDVADPTEDVILVVDQPFGNHNGGTIAFGADGFLYFSPGDGGSSNDPGNRSQDPQTLLGKMLRLDVGLPPAPGSIVRGAYAIPADNPFVGAADPGDAVLDEIWSFGLRNAYRFSFDRLTGDLWIADVGQGAREEVNFEQAGLPGGRNYGWDVMEGTLCNLNDPTPPPAPGCFDPRLTLPIYQYSHNAGNCSITGGFVYRGRKVLGLRGHYVFGDFCSGRIWSLDLSSGGLTDRTAALAPAAGSGFDLVGFGQDGRGELYVVLLSGSVYRIGRPPPECSDGVDNDGDGNVDWPEDRGCLNPGWPDEAPACSNGEDDDLDGFEDLEDPDCHGHAAWVTEEPVWCGVDAVGPEPAAVFLGAFTLAGRRRRRQRRQGA